MRSDSRIRVERSQIAATRYNRSRPSGREGRDDPRFPLVRLGAVITAVTYAAAEAGGRYMLFWGPMAYGGYRLVRAIYYWLNPKALVRSVQ
jgi:hypothetical protein